MTVQSVVMSSCFFFNTFNELAALVSVVALSIHSLPCGMWDLPVSAI